jgi:hypothetical protein
MALAYASSYGAVPVSGYHKMAFVNEDLGDEQSLEPSNILGFGRAPLAPDQGPIDNRGSLVVPVDQRLIGVWLKLIMGPPTTTQGVAAAGSIAFPVAPAANDTFTIGGVAFTFKAALSGANQVLLGATPADSIRNAVRTLNALTAGAASAARYSTDKTAGAINILHKTIGTAGNALTLAASVGTPSGGTLAGGSASGPYYNHVFTAGGLSLLDAAIEVGLPDVPTFAMNYGVTIDGITIPISRSAKLDATLNYIAQGELPRTTTTAAGTPAALALDRFSQFSGQVLDRGVPLGGLVGGQFVFSNGSDPVENTGARIEGVDAGDMSMTPQYVIRFDGPAMLDLANAGTPLEMLWAWDAGAGKSLTFRQAAVRLPKVKVPVTGPKGLQVTYPAIAHQDTAGAFLTATLVNDVPNYD